MVVLVKMINQFDSISYLFNDKFDDSEIFETKNRKIIAEVFHDVESKRITAKELALHLRIC